MDTKIRTFPLPNSCLHHDHDHHQLVIALNGQAEFEVGGRGGRVDVLHGCLVPSNEVHFYEGIGDNVHVVMDMPLGLVGDDLGRLFELPRYFEADGSMRLLLAYMQREATTWELFPEAAEGVVTGFLATLYRQIFPGNGIKLPRGKLDLATIEHFIQLYLHEPMPISRLAALAHVSPGHFYVLFRQATGMTPGQYLQEARLQRARQLLLETAMPLVDIAERVGFSSQSALTHAFRRRYGQAPGLLRRQV
ncbi:AraC family transcriptional regulator [Zobellella iuensis]|uniref:Helix-turn-helix domain-containing protein n=1 Tax=Zobellella iuensis TaxID=2803811 RepID=A0ABS1QMH7_9GAMM|nr:AraC family transcriptional regulator [Zobellella iuensis]MBL1376061.1 helix-turn-helix domain-containing protein [Zobellella iuensis]